MYTRGRTDRITHIPLAIARKMGYSKQDLRILETACRLHDIGMIGTLDSILSKPGRLTDDEYETVKQHIQHGLKIVEPLDSLDEIKPIAFSHHERWDGKGYPDGLEGEQIPLSGRIMAVADAYDAMISDRPYRNGMPGEKVLSILREGAGSQWDPNIVEVLPEIIEPEEG